MSRKTVTTGSGITAREHESVDGADLIPALRLFFENWDRASKGKNDFDARIARIEQWALSVLKKAGIEPDGIQSGTTDTRENYAQKFIRKIHSIRAFIKRGESAQAARYAVNLGVLMGEAEMKFKWESFALKGKAFSGNKRGLSARSREVVKILESRGADYPAKSVWRDLEAAGVIRAGAVMTKPFESNLSRLRARIR